MISEVLHLPDHHHHHHHLLQCFSQSSAVQVQLDCAYSSLRFLFSGVLEQKFKVSNKTAEGSLRPVHISVITLAVIRTESFCSVFCFVVLVSSAICMGFMKSITEVSRGKMKVMSPSERYRVMLITFADSVFQTKKEAP